MTLHARKILLHLANQQAPMSFVVGNTHLEHVEIDPCFFRDLSRELVHCATINTDSVETAIRSVCRNRHKYIKDEYKPVISAGIVKLIESTYG